VWQKDVRDQVSPPGRHHESDLVNVQACLLPHNQSLALKMPRTRSHVSLEIEGVLLFHGLCYGPFLAQNLFSDNPSIFEGDDTICFGTESRVVRG
jgi:hypothetical protein